MKSPGQMLGADLAILLHSQQTEEMVVNRRRSGRPNKSVPSAKEKTLGQMSRGTLSMGGREENKGSVCDFFSSTNDASAVSRARGKSIL